MRHAIRFCGSWRRSVGRTSGCVKVEDDATAELMRDISDLHALPLDRCIQCRSAKTRFNINFYLIATTIY